MTHRSETPARSRELVLSLFPGVGLLDMGFEMEGFSVVRGPDLIFGGDVRRFTVPAGKFEGIIGGPPCQDFSSLRRVEPTGNGLEMLGEFCRLVTEAQPLWFILENVARVPSVTVQGFAIQRMDFMASDYGLGQRRLRHVQFGSREGMIITPSRSVTGPGPVTAGRVTDRCVTTKCDGRTFEEICQLQGVPLPFDLPSFTKEGKFRAVGNGVPVPMARDIARAVTGRSPAWMNVELCCCGCGRGVTGRESSAGPSCRKRLERARKRQSVTRQDESKRDSGQPRESILEETL